MKQCAADLSCLGDGVAIFDWPAYERPTETNMANIENRWTEQCSCTHGCPTYARITEWSCGCVEVDIHRDQRAGSDCSDFSSMRRRCGKPGAPGDD